MQVTIANKVEHLSLRPEMIPGLAPDMLLFIMNKLKMKDASMGIKNDRKMFDTTSAEQSTSNKVPTSFPLIII